MTIMRVIWPVVPIFTTEMKIAIELDIGIPQLLWSLPSISLKSTLMITQLISPSTLGEAPGCQGIALWLTKCLEARGAVVHWPLRCLPVAKSQALTWAWVELALRVMSQKMGTTAGWGLGRRTAMSIADILQVLNGLVHRKPQISAISQLRIHLS